MDAPRYFRWALPTGYRPSERTADVALLLLRLGVAGFMVKHGLSKVTAWDTMINSFADPIGVGTTPSFLLAVFAEFVCSIAVMIGLFTRLATLPILVTMAVAAFVVHADDPWTRKELPLLFAQGFLAIALLGPGRFSIDGLWARRAEARDNGRK